MSMMKKMVQKEGLYDFMEFDGTNVDAVASFLNLKDYFVQSKGEVTVIKTTDNLKDCHEIPLKSGTMILKRPLVKETLFGKSYGMDVHTIGKNIVEETMYEVEVPEEFGTALDKKMRADIEKSKKETELRDEECSRDCQNCEDRDKCDELNEMIKRMLTPGLRDEGKMSVVEKNTAKILAAILGRN